MTPEDLIHAAPAIAKGAAAVGAAAPDYSKHLEDIIRAIHNLPASPDYTKQLNEIVAALSRPTIAPWVIALIGAAVGVLGTGVVQVLLAFFYDRLSRYKMRRMLYKDLGEMFLAVDNIRRTQLGEHWQRGQYEQNLQFKTLEYLQANPTTYMQLSERRSADMLYPRFKMLHEDPTDDNASFVVRMFADRVHDGFLRKQEFERFLDKESALNILTRVDKIYTENRVRIQAKLNKMTNAGSDETTD